MDPLSVAAGVVGLITAASKISSLLTTITRQTRAAPKLAQATLAEIDDIRATLVQLQLFLLGTATAPKGRASLILVEQVIVTLTGCVTTFSELDEALQSLTTDGAMGSLDRVRWAMKESTIAAIMQRLHTHRVSITLMLTILGCRSNDEAQQSMNRLCVLVEQVLQSNQDMSRRIRTLEAGSAPRNHQTDNDSDRASITTPVPSDEPVSRSAFKFAFDEDLSNSRVYKRTMYSNSGESLVSSAARSTASSVLSGLSLADVSVVSVFALPVYANEISNRQLYAFGDQPDIAQEELVVSGQSLDPREDENRTSHMDRLSLRDRLTRTVQGRKAYSASSTNQSVHMGTVPPAPQVQGPSPSSKGLAERMRANLRRYGQHSTNGSLTPAKSAMMIFGVPLAKSIKYANVAIFVSDDAGNKYLYGYVPLIVAKCGIFLKEKGTEVPDIFRKSGNPQRLLLLEQAFDNPQRNHGKGLDWTGFTVHDCANMLLRYLNLLPEPIVPRDLYDKFREPLRQNAKSMAATFALKHEQQETTIKAYQALVQDLPPLNRCLLRYLLDMLAVFADKWELTGMKSESLAVIFQNGILSPPLEDVVDNQAQDVLIFLIENQDHFEISTSGLETEEHAIARNQQKLEAPSNKPLRTP